MFNMFNMFNINETFTAGRDGPIALSPILSIDPPIPALISPIF